MKILSFLLLKFLLEQSFVSFVVIFFSVKMG